ncbi:MAG: 4'-phosphopantetheinyl transferase superfamily protein [Vicinamibacterales bacterium]
MPCLRQTDRGAFSSTWTLKEAYVKARGAGLALPLDTFAFVDPSADRPRVIFDAGFDNVDRWQFDRVVIGSHLVAVASTLPDGRPVRLSVRQFDARTVAR